MARIRTIKPDFFRHEALYEAEIEFSLPLRLAFAGLWTACDREGRFKWKPKALKLDCLPYDDVDFSRVLDALATRGFVVKYTVDGCEYGLVPSFKQHQVINNRETKSVLPDVSETIEENDASSTRDPRVEHASCGEGKGREGKGIEKENLIKEKIDAPEEKEEYYHKTTISQSFVPCSEAIADINRKGLDFNDTLKAFINHYTANKHKVADWQAQFRAWVANARPQNQNQQIKKPKRKNWG